MTRTEPPRAPFRLALLSLAVVAGMAPTHSLAQATLIGTWQMPGVPDAPALQTRPGAFFAAVAANAPKTLKTPNTPNPHTAASSPLLAQISAAIASALSVGSSVAHAAQPQAPLLATPNSNSTVLAVHAAHDATSAKPATSASLAQPLQNQSQAVQPARPVPPSTAVAPAVSARAAQPAAPSGSGLDCMIQPHLVVQVGTASPGVIQQVQVERGDSVRKGQALVLLNNEVERANVAVARERASQAGEIVSTRGAHDLAKREALRAEELVRENFVSHTFFDRQRAEATVAAGRGQQAEEKRRLSSRELELASAQLAQRVVRSPIDGVVVERFVSPGEYVEQKPVLRIAAIDPLRVDVLVPAAAFGQVSVGATGRVVPELLNRRAHEARVTSVDRVIDAASNTFRVRLELANPGGALPPGLRCKVDLALRAVDPAGGAASGPDALLGQRAVPGLPLAAAQTSLQGAAPTALLTNQQTGQQTNQQTSQQTSQQTAQQTAPHAALHAPLQAPAQAPAQAMPQTPLGRTASPGPMPAPAAPGLPFTQALLRRFEHQMAALYGGDTQSPAAPAADGAAGARVAQAPVPQPEALGAPAPAPSLGAVVAQAPRNPALRLRMTLPDWPMAAEPANLPALAQTPSLMPARTLGTAPGSTRGSTQLNPPVSTQGTTPPTQALEPALPTPTAVAQLTPRR